MVLQSGNWPAVAVAEACMIRRTRYTSKSAAIWPKSSSISWPQNFNRKAIVNTKTQNHKYASACKYHEPHRYCSVCPVPDNGTTIATQNQVVNEGIAQRHKKGLLSCGHALKSCSINPKLHTETVAFSNRGGSLVNGSTYYPTPVPIFPVAE